MEESNDAVPSTNESTDHDDDDWSRRVETDGSQFLSTSVLMDEDGDSVVDNGIQRGISSTYADSNGTSPRVATAVVNDGILEADSTAPAPGLVPKRVEPTLKEKLVERERQRRVETERARLKRQFALASNGGGGSIDEDASLGGNATHSVREHGSVAGTVGEGSSVAQHEPFDESEDQKIPYPMARFLQEQGTVDEENSSRRLKKREDESGVVMERFLQQPVVVASPEPRPPDPERSANVDRTVSFDMEPQASESAAPTSEQAQALDEARPISSIGTASMPSFADSADGDEVQVSMGGMNSMASVEANASTDADTASHEKESVDEVVPPTSLGELSVATQASTRIRATEPDSASVDRSAISEEPRFLRLTEAEIQEMAAIDEASRSNAPPSDRDDISESSFVGEMADFGAPSVDNAGNLSQGTPTTAMESGSVVSGNRSIPTSDHAGDNHSLTGSISSHLMTSSAGGDVSVTANPPSEIARDEPAPSSIPAEIRPIVSPQERLDEGDERATEIANDVDIAAAPRLPIGGDDGLNAMTCSNEGIVNRRSRPGMVNLKPAKTASRETSDSVKRSSSVPDNLGFDVDGFDYDKHAPLSPRSGLSDSIRDLPADDNWSPVGKMAVSPLHVARKPTVSIPPPVGFLSGDIESNREATYGSAGVVFEKHPETGLGAPLAPDIHHISSKNDHCDETKPLLLRTCGVPSEIVAPNGKAQQRSSSTPNPVLFRSSVNDAFNSVRSQSTEAFHAQTEADVYQTSSIIARGELLNPFSKTSCTPIHDSSNVYCSFSRTNGDINCDNDY